LKIFCEGEHIIVVSILDKVNPEVAKSIMAQMPEIVKGVIPVAVHTDKSTKTVIYKSTAFRDQLERRCYLLLMPISLIRFITIL
jgi:hypothetical protein